MHLVAGFEDKLPFAGQMAVCCQNLTLGVLSSRSAPSMLVGALYKKFGLFLNTPRVYGSLKTVFLMSVLPVKEN